MEIFSQGRDNTGWISRWLNNYAEDIHPSFRLNQTVPDWWTEIAGSGGRAVHTASSWPTILSAHLYEDIQGALIRLLGNTKLEGENCSAWQNLDYGDFSSLYQWAKTNKMRFNGDKCKVLCLG